MPVIAFFAVALATLLDVKVFNAWGQVQELWLSDVNPFLLIEHPHMPRYLVAYPGLVLEEVFPNVGFSLYIAFFFGINLALFRAVALLAIHRQPSLLTYVGFIAFHLVMNGRGVIAWTGWLICVWICLRIYRQWNSPISYFGWAALSFWLAAVSTGVFSVVSVTFALFFMRHYLRSTQPIQFFHKLLAFCLVLPLAYFVIEYFLIAAEKNVEFYGGGVDGFFQMLEHGLGYVFLEFNTFSVLLLFLLAFLVLILLVMMLSGRRISHLETLIAIPFFGGFFGFTTLTLMIPLMLLRVQLVQLGGRRKAY